MTEIQKSTEAQRLVRLALTEDKTMVVLAEEMGVSRQAIHFWKKGEHSISKEHRAKMMAIIGMDENMVWDEVEAVFNLKLELQETKNALWDTEEKLTEAELELKGWNNGETEREMGAVCMRFAELIDREESRAEEIETLKVDNAALVRRAVEADALAERLMPFVKELADAYENNRNFSCDEFQLHDVERLAREAVKALDNQKKPSEDKANEG